MTLSLIAGVLALIALALVVNESLAILFMVMAACLAIILTLRVYQKTVLPTLGWLHLKGQEKAAQREAERREEAFRKREAARLAGRADIENRLFLQGDPHGVYGRFMEEDTHG